MTERIKTAATTPGVKKAFAFFNNHARANSVANAIMLSQELGIRPKAMPGEAMVAKFRQLADLGQSSCSVLVMSDPDGTF